MMNSNTFVAIARTIAEQCKTLYVMGCFGAPMTGKNKSRYMSNNPYNMRPERQAMIAAASSDTYGFDCCGLIKGILWGWDGDLTANYGGAEYASNGVPDLGADQLIAKCTGVSTNFAEILPGEMLWKTGHCGIYIGSGKAVECTPAWNNCVQITDVENMGSSGDRPARTWVKHGRLPYVEYSPAMPFVDVDPKKFYYKHLLKCYRAGLISGTDATHFTPEGKVTRAQLVTVIGRLLEKMEE